MITPETNAPIVFERDGKQWIVRVQEHVERSGVTMPTSVDDAKPADLDAAGYISKAEASRLLNDLQQSHVKALAGLVPKAEREHLMQAAELLRRCERTGPVTTFELQAIHADMCAWASRDKQYATSAKVEPPERAWLIERQYGGAPEWAIVEHSPERTRVVRWTFRAREATRYDEREHALDVLPLIEDESREHTVTEHVWESQDSSTPSPAGQVATEEDRPVITTVAGKLRSAKHYLDMHRSELESAKLADYNASAVFWLLKAVEQLADELEGKASK